MAVKTDGESIIGLLCFQCFALILLVSNREGIQPVKNLSGVDMQAVMILLELVAY